MKIKLTKIDNIIIKWSYLMKRIMVSTLLLLLFVTSAHAKILSINTSLKDTTERASLIVVGKVIDIKPFGDDKLAVIEIKSILKGKPKVEEVGVFFYGPNPSADKTSVDMELRILQFTKGERCIVFLYKKESLDEYYRVVNHWHGKLTILEIKDGEFVKPPFFFRNNDKLKEVEPLETIKNLIKSYLKL